jgi:hypothetical protein
MQSCIQCKQEIEAGEGRCPHCGADQIERNGEFDANRPQGASVAARIAGAVLVLNAALALVGMFFAPEQSGPINPVGSAAVDLILGGGLVIGSVKHLRFVLIRVVLGFLLYSGIAISQSDWFSLGGQAALSTGLFLLLIGRPASFRIAVSLSVLSVYALVALAGTQYLATGRSALTPLVMHSHYDLSALSGARVQFHDDQYSIGGLPNRWLLRSPAEARRENPVCSVWLVNPDFDAHIQVIAERLKPSADIVSSEVADFVISNFEEALDGFHLEERKQSKINNLAVEVVEVTGTVEGLSLQYRVGCYGSDNTAIQVICFAGERVFSEIAADCDSAISSLTSDR